MLEEEKTKGGEKEKKKCLCFSFFLSVDLFGILFKNEHSNMLTTDIHSITKTLMSITTSTIRLFFKKKINLFFTVNLKKGFSNQKQFLLILRISKSNYLYFLNRFQGFLFFFNENIFIKVILNSTQYFN
jgi:hypothetical protein